MTFTETKRAAVTVIFFTFGIIGGGWMSRLPEVQEYFGMSNTLLSTVLICISAGSLVTMPFTNWLTHKWGSRNILTWAAYFNSCFITLMPFFPNAYTLMPGFFLWGCVMGSMDVAVNGQAVTVEKMYGKPIMSSFHAFFSVGTIVGGLAGTFFAENHIFFGTQYIFLMLVSLVLTFWGVNNLVNEETKPENEADNENPPAFLRLPTRAILPLGIIAFCGMAGEGAMFDWSAIYMNKIVGKDVAFSAMALTVFTIAMTTGRFLGDYLTLRLGKRGLLIFNSTAAIIGLSISLIFVEPFAVLIGFFIIGISLSSIVPIIYSTAGNMEDVTPSTGISMATTIGYAGFFVCPPVIGFLADATNLRWGLTFILFLFFVMLALVYRYRFK